MEFFNRKEEVIDIKMTQYGKKRYSEGKFNPKFYSFSDEDVIYDFSYSGTTEPEHSASIRIKDSLRMKIPSSFVGIDSTIENMLKEQQDLEKYYSRVKTITNSSPNSIHAPSWSVKSYCGKIDTHTRQKNIPGREAVNIPQLTLENLNFKLIKVQNPTPEQIFFGLEQEDGSYCTITSEEGEFLFSFAEENTPSIEEKFDIQVFEISTDVNGNETLQELKFPKSPKKIIDGMYVENTLPDEEIDDTYASSRFIIETDYNIEKSFMTENVGDQIAILRQGEIRRVNDSDNFTTPEKPEVVNLRNISLDDIASLTTEQLRERAMTKIDETTSFYEELNNSTPELED